MGFTALLVTALAAATSAVPLISPIQAIQAAGPAAGQVITKCSSPGQIALAYDDGPYQYTQKLADILSKGGAKGTFFVTGTLYGTPLQTSRAALASFHLWSLQDKQC
jgi:peptidoglycan/xylan/chitin deacetylase (PgdA/CDA1 family)